MAVIPWYEDPQYLDYCRRPTCSEGSTTACKEEQYEYGCLKPGVRDLKGRMAEVEVELDKRPIPQDDNLFHNYSNDSTYSYDSTYTDSGSVYIGNDCTPSLKNRCARQIADKQIFNIDEYERRCKLNGTFREYTHPNYGKYGYCSNKTIVGCTEYGLEEMGFMANCRGKFQNEYVPDKGKIRFYDTETQNEAIARSIWPM